MFNLGGCPTNLNIKGFYSFHRAPMYANAAYIRPFLAGCRNIIILPFFSTFCPPALAVLRSRESVGLILPASLPQTETKPKPAGGCGRVVCLSFLPHDEREGKNLDRRRGIDASLLSQLPTFFSLTITLIGFPYNSFSPSFSLHDTQLLTFPAHLFQIAVIYRSPLLLPLWGVGVSNKLSFSGNLLRSPSISSFKTVLISVEKNLQTMASFKSR